MFSARNGSWGRFNVGPSAWKPSPRRSFLQKGGLPAGERLTRGQDGKEKAMFRLTG